MPASRVEPSQAPADSSRRPDPVEMVAGAARHGIAGGLAGFIGIGVIGLRGTMRLLTITSGEAGRLTENDNRAGEFTVEGTLFLVVAGTLLGALIAFMYGAIRRGLPKNILLSALLTAPFVARLLVLDPDNVDFTRFGPSWVAIAGFTFGCFIYTFTLEATLRWLGRAWRMPTWANFVLGVPPVLLLVAVGLPGVIGLDPVGVVLAALAAVLLLGWWRHARWLKNLPTGLAALWIVGGIAWWLQSVVELV